MKNKIVALTLLMFGFALLSIANANRMAEIAQGEYDALSRKVQAFNTGCYAYFHDDSPNRSMPGDMNSCEEKRYALAADLGRFIAVANDALSCNPNKDIWAPAHKELLKQRRTALQWLTDL